MVSMQARRRGRKEKEQGHSVIPPELNTGMQLFLLTVGSFLLTMELFYLQLTILDFFLQLELSCLQLCFFYKQLEFFCLQWESASSKDLKGL